MFLNTRILFWIYLWLHTIERLVSKTYDVFKIFVYYHLTEEACVWRKMPPCRCILSELNMLQIALGQCYSPRQFAASLLVIALELTQPSSNDQHASKTELPCSHLRQPSIFHHQPVCTPVISLRVLTCHTISIFASTLVPCPCELVNCTF